MRPLALVAGVIAVLASSYSTDELSAELLLVAAYLVSPWALLAFGVRELDAAARGIALFIVTLLAVAMYLSIFTDDSSTAALGLLWLPPAQWLAVGAVVTVQRFDRRDATAQTSRQAAESYRASCRSIK